MAGILSKEWLNDNLSKAYPLADNTGGSASTLPPSLLVDGVVIAETPGVVSARISSLKVSDTVWSMSLLVTYRNTQQVDTPVNYEDIITVSLDSDKNTVAKFLKSVDGKTISGSFTIGCPDAVADWPAITYFLNSDTGLHPSVIHELTDLFLTGIKVGDTVLTGEIELIAGDGIELSVDENTNGIRITNTKYAVDNTIIYDDQSLLDAVVARYGAPIRSISGVLPDADGNINIVVPAEYSAVDEYVSIAASNSEAGVLTIALAKDPCLNINDIQVAVDNLDALNERAAKLDAGVKALDSALNRLATQMSRM